MNPEKPKSPPQITEDAETADLQRRFNPRRLSPRELRGRPGFSKIRQRLIALREFDNGANSANAERARESFLFGYFVNDDGDVLAVRNFGNQKENPDGWEVMRIIDGENGDPTTAVDKVTKRVCTPARVGESMRILPEGVAAVETLHLKSDDSLNILCGEDGSFAVADRGGKMYLQIENLVGGNDEQEVIDRRFEDIIRSPESGLGELATVAADKLAKKSEENMPIAV